MRETILICAASVVIAVVVGSAARMLGADDLTTGWFAGCSYMISVHYSKIF